jgi:predicted RNA-binding Zn-ribbon protein involved in translation (DUF1610 family)
MKTTLVAQHCPSCGHSGLWRVAATSGRVTLECPNCPWSQSGITDAA